MDSRIVEMSKHLQKGNPTSGWRGDERMYVQIGVLDKTVNGQVVARKNMIEVRRVTETGEDVNIGWWEPAEVDRIILDIIQQDPRTPGHVDVLDRIDKHNAKLEKAADDSFRETYTEFTEHLAHVASAELGLPKTRFGQVGGFKKPKLKRAKKS